ncbi:hypothetical protein [Microbulbifer sp. ANSA005]|uniref:hypothetical protein n=1 Tax=Microbulbifer sp. ANSA005 TaxID=3243362 RepID=UPI004043111C
MRQARTPRPAPKINQASQARPPPSGLGWTAYAPLRLPLLEMLLLQREVMRIFQLLILIFILTGCVKHHSEDEFDIDLVEKSAIEILKSNPGNSIVNIEKLPLSLSKLKPYSVRTGETGIYITLDKSFVSESGIYISRTGYTPNTSEGLDPSFKLLKSRTFSYVLKG